MYINDRISKESRFAHDIFLCICYLLPIRVYTTYRRGCRIDSIVLVLKELQMHFDNNFCQSPTYQSSMPQIYYSDEPSVRGADEKIAND
jgi:hypothetical protein